MNKEVDNERRVRELDSDPEALKAFYRHYRDTCYGSGAVSLTWAREASVLILELMERLDA